MREVRFPSVSPQRDIGNSETAGRRAWIYIAKRGKEGRGKRGRVRGRKGKVGIGYVFPLR